MPRQLSAICALVLLAGLAAALRLWSLSAVPSDPFYDAAVRSMPLSLHNFLLGAYDPGGSLAVDKPPLDLWLQVLSTQLLGFTSFALKLPPAIAGTAGALVLYDAVRRVFGLAAGVAAGVALAVLPIAVLSARSDTMDSVSMLLSVIALWSLVRFAHGGRRLRWCLLAAAAMGLAFEVKLFEGLVALPALLLFGLLVSRERRLVRLAASSAVFLVVALGWLTTMTLLFPASQRPYAIGSTDGSAWNAAFVFNGYDRIAGASTQPALSAQLSPGQLKPANNSEVARSAVPIGAPALLRLFDHNGPLSGLRLGFLLLLALLLGVPALAWAIARPRGPDGGIERAFGAALLVWLVIGVVLFSAMARLHPRYTEGFTPAVAAAAGIGCAWALRDGLWQRVLTVAGAVGLALYGRWLLDGSSTTWRLTAAGAIAACVALLLPAARLRLPLLSGGLALAALALPLQVDASLISNHEFDSGRTGALSNAYVHDIGSYIAAHAPAARYEFAAADPTEVAALIVADRRPILSLTSYDEHELLPIKRLRALVSSGQLRFAVLDGGCGRGAAAALLPGCSAGAAWVRAHGSDVSRRAGLPHAGVLYLLRTR
ncbi:MAG TPA: glycosyltransferase family 39 protein [Solirubrobacteraceae bacterium]|jgi:4-amino-4-deoxy-L-arabinose transferase-like glycosyltransferase|nr:glycosyltransferase family 39 protein [Solirubrobacteraceae bacterium]